MPIPKLTIEHGLTERDVQRLNHMVGMLDAAMQAIPGSQFFHVIAAIRILANNHARTMEAIGMAEVADTYQRLSDILKEPQAEASFYDR